VTGKATRLLAGHPADDVDPICKEETMLVLSRKVGEKVVIGNCITVTVVGVIGNKVRLGISAPEDVSILRSELARWMPPPDEPERIAGLSNSPFETAART
jgi:carbon storage regulator